MRCFYVTCLNSIWRFLHSAHRLTLIAVAVIGPAPTHLRHVKLPAVSVSAESVSSLLSTRSVSPPFILDSCLFVYLSDFGSVCDCLDCLPVSLSLRSNCCRLTGALCCAAD